MGTRLGTRLGTSWALVGHYLGVTSVVAGTQNTPRRKGGTSAQNWGEQARSGGQQGHQPLHTRSPVWHNNHRCQPAALNLARAIISSLRSPSCRTGVKDNYRKHVQGHAQGTSRHRSLKSVPVARSSHAEGKQCLLRPSKRMHQGCLRM